MKNYITIKISFPKNLFNSQICALRKKNIQITLFPQLQTHLIGTQFLL